MYFEEWEDYGPIILIHIILCRNNNQHSTEYLFRKIDNTGYQARKHNLQFVIYQILFLPGVIHK